MLWQQGMQPRMPCSDPVTPCITMLAQVAVLRR